MWNNVRFFRVIYIFGIISFFVFLYKTSESRSIQPTKRKYERKLKLDRREAPTDEYFVNRIAKEIPYLPIEDLNNHAYEYRFHNQTCAWYPSLRDVKIHNEYWQLFINRDISYYIFGAYYDNRPTVVQDQPVIRVLAMLNFIGKSYEEYPLTYCHLWYDEMPQPYITPMKEMQKIWYYDWGNSLEFNYGHFVVCPIMEEHKDWIPKTISLVAEPCDKASNNVRVIYIPLALNETKKDFAVCIKGLDFPRIDLSHRLVEYIETLRILGAEKIQMYRLQVHDNITKILEYYERIGFLEYRPITLSKAISNLREFRHLAMHKDDWSKTLDEVVPYNDCLYRNMYRYNYVAVVDIDEILMPLGNITNWRDLIDFAETITTPDCKIFASFCFRNIYFPSYSQGSRYTEDIPEYFYMLQHVRRVKKHTQPDSATKCLHNTERVVAVHNHFSIHWLWGVCHSYSFEPDVAQMHHYRKVDDMDILDDPVVDLSLWRLKDEIVKHSNEVFEKLDFFEEED